MISYHPDTKILKSLSDAATKVMLGISPDPEKEDKEEITEEQPQEEVEVLKEGEGEDPEPEPEPVAESEGVELDDDVQAARNATPGEPDSHKIELVLDGVPKNFLTTFDLSDPKFVKGLQEVVADKIREYQKIEEDADDEKVA
tara:strand:+ start:354 stop:782 length:429 start_codon:yes stop_codon:yes gene_type:complete